MRFQVPQFIETEINIVGPFTLKQFLFIGSGAAMIFLVFSVFGGALAFIISVPIAAVAAAFAFLKIDGLPLINYVANALSFVLGPKEYRYTPGQQGTDYTQQTKLKQ